MINLYYRWCKQEGLPLIPVRDQKNLTPYQKMYQDAFTSIWTDEAETIFKPDKERSTWRLAEWLSKKLEARAAKRRTMYI